MTTKSVTALAAATLALALSASLFLAAPAVAHPAPSAAPTAITLAPPKQAAQGPNAGTRENAGESNVLPAPYLVAPNCNNGCRPKGTA
jgi:hypothetical protein